MFTRIRRLWRRLRIIRLGEELTHSVDRGVNGWYWWVHPVHEASVRLDFGYEPSWEAACQTARRVAAAAN